MNGALVESREWLVAQRWLLPVLILIGVVVNAWGTRWFLNPLIFD